MSAILSSSGVKSKDFQHGDDIAGDNMLPSKSEQSAEPDQRLVPRPAPLIWFLVCVGLYLGALLYGKNPVPMSHAVLPKTTQVSIPP